MEQKETLFQKENNQKPNQNKNKKPPKSKTESMHEEMMQSLRLAWAYKSLPKKSEI